MTVMKIFMPERTQEIDPEADNWRDFFCYTEEEAEKIKQTLVADKNIMTSVMGFLKENNIAGLLEIIRLAFRVLPQCTCHDMPDKKVENNEKV